MTPNDSKQAFLERLNGRKDRTVGGALMAMLDFYAQERADGRALGEDGDMLLYEWGTYDWGDGEHFELNVTRKFILDGQDEPFQLSMTLLFDPTDECIQLGHSNKWCLSPDGLDEFADFVRKSPPFGLLGGRVCPKVTVAYSQC